MKEILRRIDNPQNYTAEQRKITNRIVRQLQESIEDKSAMNLRAIVDPLSIQRALRRDKSLEETLATHIRNGSEPMKGVVEKLWRMFREIDGKIKKSKHGTPNEQKDFVSRLKNANVGLQQGALSKAADEWLHERNTGDLASDFDRLSISVVQPLTIRGSAAEDNQLEQRPDERAILCAAEVQHGDISPSSHGIDRLPEATLESEEPLTLRRTSRVPKHTPKYTAWKLDVTKSNGAEKSKN